MSTRGGQFVTLRELRQEVGADAARFFYVLRKLAQHLDFDLELAKSHSSKNPVYYIQYAHARICSVLRQLSTKQWQWDKKIGLDNLDCLILDQERTLLLYLQRYPEIIESSALQYEPHQLAYYLQELAHAFHAYYNTEQFLVENENLRQARLCLIIAVRQVISNGLDLLGVSSPETM
jgi:arginyl-tRNA synthetase